MQRLAVEEYKKPLAEGHVLTLTAMSCLRTLLYVQQKYDAARVLQVATQKEMSKFDSDAGGNDEMLARMTSLAL
jgi:hypothetical protein